ncbi:DUF3887 domain-containing protein [Eggerthella sinensis]|uniref:DUF3887 domain-containing protein n=1 Tax=Eggerthella sinensis TaxID=242230 RepID=UPI001D08D00D|nr:DUF3887 domain-containing protein [Eggerthella sinensis]MCB7037215.1 DUF3887 domain-containing protein [Eggerthella sinensis]
MKKRFLIAFVLIGVVCALCLAGCQSASSVPPAGSTAEAGLPDWADEDAVKAEALEVIEEFADGDYDAVVARFDNPEVKAADFERAAATIEGVGDFRFYSDVTFARYETESDGTAAVVAQTADYVNGKLMYSVGIAESGKLTAFRVQ